MSDSSNLEPSNLPTCNSKSLSVASVASVANHPAWERMGAIAAEIFACEALVYELIGRDLGWSRGRPVAAR